MICSWCWFIHPATAISTNRNGSRTLGIVSSLSRDLRAAVTLFLADPVFGPYAMQPTSHFGEVFQYSNLMASAAGNVGARLYDPKSDLGSADKAMQNLVFTHLGMSSTTFAMARALKANHASPHGGRCGR